MERRLVRPHSARPTSARPHGKHVGVHQPVFDEEVFRENDSLQLQKFKKFRKATKEGKHINTISNQTDHDCFSTAELPRVRIRPFSARPTRLKRSIHHVKEQSEETVKTSDRPQSAVVQQSKSRRDLTNATGVFYVRGTPGQSLKPLIHVLINKGWVWCDHESFKSMLRGRRKRAGIPRLLLSVDNLSRYGVLSRDKDLFFNHFERNDEITTKRGLASNVQDLLWTAGTNPEAVLPRCYNLGNPPAIASFLQDFRITSAGSIVRLFAEYGELCMSFIEERVVRLAISLTEKRLRTLQGEVQSQPSLNESEWELIVESSRRLAECILDANQQRKTRNGVWSEGQDKAKTLVAALERKDPQWEMNGYHNIWIVKPADKSKGAGVILENNPEKIIADAKRMSGARIVQKYVEQPVLGPAGCKLDLRMWVLVTRWEPLEVWVFHPFYCRVSKAPYSLRQESLHDKTIHLCNFAVQKHSMYLTEEAFFQELERSGMLQSQQQRAELLERIEVTCLNAMRIGQNKVVPRANSFELYGVDLLVDSKLDVWLLEVNLSPGMSSHDDAFVSTLERMYSELYNIVFTGRVPEHTTCSDDNRDQDGWKRLSTTPQSGRQEKKTQGQNQEQDSRQELDLSKRQQQERRERSCGIKFLLEGRQVGKNEVSTIDARFEAIRATQVLARFATRCSSLWPQVRARRYHAACCIQSLYRGKQGRAQFRSLLECSCATRIQAQWRVYLATTELMELRFTRDVACATVIAQAYRKYRLRYALFLARKYIGRWRQFVVSRKKAAQKILQMLWSSKLRSWISARVDRRKAATRIQCIVRQGFAKKVIRELRKEREQRLRALDLAKRKALRRVKAANTIRQALRAYICVRNDSARVIQTVWRIYQEITVAARAIQRAWRDRKRLRTRCLQSVFSRWKLCVANASFCRFASRFRRAVQGARTIQRVWRRYFEKSSIQIVLYTRSFSQAIPSSKTKDASKRKRKKKGPLPSRPSKAKAAEYAKNRQQMLLSTSKTPEEIALGRSFRLHKQNRPKLPPPLL